MRTLIAEDDFTSRLLLQYDSVALWRMSHRCEWPGGRGRLRVAAASGQRYDLICMDIMMPELDGVAAVREIRALEETQGILSSVGVKIVMTTALTDVKDVVRSFRELCDGYLFKPIDAGQLLGHLQSMQLVAEAATPEVKMA